MKALATNVVTGAMLIGTLSAAAARPTTADFVIYGCTPAGITAALEGQREGKSLVLICRDRHVGGMTTNGLGFADTGNHGAIGGMARQFYRDVKALYSAHGIAAIEGQTKSKPEDRDGMWVFEPHVAETIFERWLKNARVVPVRAAPLERSGGVQRRGAHIVSIVAGGRAYRGKIFVDASYEGDLMAAAGVRFTTGREANSTYGETLNGVQVANAIHHQFDRDVDPFVVPGQPSSGLLPLIEAGPPGVDGSGDSRIQAYTYRLCMTKVPGNRAPLPKPEGYNPDRFEILRRYLAAGWRELFVKYDPIPNGKTDTNNHGAFSMDGIGMNYEYPTGSDSVRRRISDEQRRYQQGLLWFLQNDPRSPDDVRTSMQPWGLCRDEFVDNANWPREMYIREARRMVSDFVMTERHLRGSLPTPRGVGLGSYTMDSHNVRRYVDERGLARNEGDVQVDPGRPYEISYDAIVPRRSEADNLIVPVALSASHIAYGSIRMEPVFMILGQSTAVAASLALDRDVAVQDVPYAPLRARLLDRGQILEARK